MTSQRCAKITTFESQHVAICSGHLSEEIDRNWRKLQNSSLAKCTDIHYFMSNFEKALRLQFIHNPQAKSPESERDCSFVEGAEL